MERVVVVCGLLIPIVGTYSAYLFVGVGMVEAWQEHGRSVEVSCSYYRRD